MKCTCGEREKCTIKVQVSENGRMWFNNIDWIKCGKVKKQLNKAKEFYNKLKP